MPKSKKRIRREIREHRAYAYAKANKNGFDKTHCSGWVKHYTPEEIAEYEKSLKK